MATKKTSTIKRRNLQKPSPAKADSFVNGGEAVEGESKNPVGRPKGKNSDKRYRRLTAWLPKELIRDLKMLSEYEDGSNDLGDVLESLIDKEVVRSRLAAVGINKQ